MDGLNFQDKSPLLFLSFGCELQLAAEGALLVNLVANIR